MCCAQGSTKAITYGTKKESLEIARGRWPKRKKAALLQRQNISKVRIDSYPGEVCLGDRTF